MRQEERLFVDPVSSRGIRSGAFGERIDMTGVAEAAARLSAALDRLESASTSLSDARKRSAKDAAAIASLEQERVGLLARIAELEEETRALASVTEQVEGRLDGAIADIRTALGR